MSKYKFGQMDSSDTDAFISQITSGAPTTQNAQYGSLATDQPISSQIQRMLMGEEGREKQFSCLNQSIRVFLMVTNVVFLLGGLAATGVTAYVKIKDEDNFFAVCNQCETVLPFFITACLMVAAVGLLGLFATRKRNMCMIFTYNLLQGILFLLFLCWLIVIIVERTGAFDNALRNGWVNSVTSQPATICDLERAFHCTGWEASCFPNGTVPNATVAPVTPVPTASLMTHQAFNRHFRGLLQQLPFTSDSLPEGCLVCPVAQANSYPETCKSKLRDAMNSYFIAMLVVGIGGTLCSLACIVGAWKLRQQRRQTNAFVWYS